MENLKYIRASLLNIGYKCPGAPKLISDSPPDPKKAKSLNAGTEAHEMLQAAFEPKISPSMNDERQTTKTLELPSDMFGFLDWFIEDSGIYDKRSHVLGCEVELEGYGRLTGHADLILSDNRGLHVIDWKYGDGQKFILPEIDEDLQMLAYAVMVMQKYQAWPIFVHRVRISDREDDWLELDRDRLESAGRLVNEVVDDIRMSCDIRAPGAFCEHCLASKHCPEWKQQAHEAKALIAAPPKVLSSHQAYRWALARGAVKNATDEMDKALRLFLDNGGEVRDDGKILRSVGGMKDRICNVRAIEEILADEVGEEFARRAIKVKSSTSKRAINEALVSKNIHPARRKKIIERMERVGAIVKTESTPSLRWCKER